jgi:HEAT repeat protein
MRRIHAGLIIIALGGVAVAGAQAPQPSKAPSGPQAEAAAAPIREVPPPAADTTDPADSLYRAGRSALNRNRYQEASEAFGQIYDRYPESRYAADAMYWHAFALYRLGGTSNLRTALARLDRQAEEYPAAATRGDARTLATRISGELARGGDARAAERIAAAAASAAEAHPAPAARPHEPASGGAVRAPRPPRTPRPPRAPNAMGHADECEDEDDTRTAALHALLQMDEERAAPILKRILARRDDASICLRRRAVFMVAQKGGDEAQSILLDAVRNDPDAEVRGQAVFWLAQTGSPQAVGALDSIARTSNDPDVQGRAIFGLGQIHDERATSALRAFVERNDTDPDLKANAIFWLGQRQEAGNGEFLRSHFSQTDDEDVRGQILFAISQDPSDENQRWLLELAKNPNQSIETRKQALFWAANQGHVPTGDLIELYRTMPDTEMRKQVVFVLSQRDDAEAIGHLLTIARETDDPEVRKQAVFWLGQSDDPRVTEYLEELLSE